MSYWLIDRTLPGVAASAIWALALWVSHRKLGTRLDAVIDRQNEHIDRLTAEQTAALSGRNPGGAP